MALDSSTVDVLQLLSPGLSPPERGDFVLSLQGVPCRVRLTGGNVLLSIHELDATNRERVSPESWQQALKVEKLVVASLGDNHSRLVIDPPTKGAVCPQNHPELFQHSVGDLVDDTLALVVGGMCLVMHD